MEAITSLGINGKMLIAQVVNFLILLIILNRLLYKPLINVFDQRREKIEKGLKDAEDAAGCKLVAEEDAEKIRQKAYADANDILSSAKSEATEEAKKIVNEAHKHAEKIVANASDESASLKKSVLTEAKTEISDLISLSLSKIVGKGLNQESRQRLTTQAVKELQQQ